MLFINQNIYFRRLSLKNFTASNISSTGIFMGNKKVKLTSSKLVSETPKLEIPSFFLDLSSSMKRSSKSPLWALVSGRRKVTSLELSSINLAFFTNFLTKACSLFLVNWRNSSVIKTHL